MVFVPLVEADLAGIIQALKTSGFDVLLRKVNDAWRRLVEA